MGQQTHCTEWVRWICFSVVAKGKAVLLAVFPAVAEPHLQQVQRQYREARPTAYSQRTSGRSAGCFLLPNRLPIDFGFSSGHGDPFALANRST